MATGAPRESNALTIVAMGAIFLLIVVGAVYLLAFNPLAIRVSTSSVSVPERFSFDAQCQADNQHCTFTVANDAQSTHTLTVRVTGATPAGAVITPATATAAPGASATITIALPARTCQAQITFNATYPQQPIHDMPFALPMLCATPTR